MNSIRSIPIGSLPNYHSPDIRYLYAEWMEIIQ